MSIESSFFDYDVEPDASRTFSPSTEPTFIERHGVERYVVVPPDAPKRPTDAQWAAKKSNDSSQAAKEWWTAFGEEVAGRTIVPAADYAITQLQLDAIAANKTISEVLATGDGEVSMFWTDEASGVYCKARADWAQKNDSGDWLMDLKSTVDESPDGFSRSAARMGYHRQAAHYLAGWKACTGRNAQFMFAAVTSAKPVLAVPYVLTDEIAEQGRDEVDELLALYANCQKSGTWPTYGDGLMLLDFPAWATRSNEVEVSYVD
jgi:exodeoxyribonuclease VIII